MEFVINRNVFLKSLSHTIGIIEKKTTLPILSNILIEAKKSKIKIEKFIGIPILIKKKLSEYKKISKKILTI